MMKVNSIRVFFAFLIVPLFPATFAMPPTRELGIWLLTYGFSYLTFLLFGLPLFFMLKSKDGLKAIPVMFGGLIVGGLVGLFLVVQVLSASEEFAILDSLIVLVTFGILGIITAFLWWIIAIWSYNKSPQPTARGGD